MKILRWFITISFVITTALFVVFFIGEKRTTDNTIPVIKVEDDLIEVSINATKQDLLKGVTAYDEKDKDLTDRIIIESVSKFIDEGVCKVVYAVCDNDKNVANATRKIKYVDYESPKYSVNKSLCFSIYDKVNISQAIQAVDCIDGDISRSIIVTSEDFTGSVVGVYSIDVSVTNSKGDISNIKLPLVVEDRSLSAPEIELSQYLVYTKIGEEIDFQSFISGVESKTQQEILVESVRVESDININEAGTYAVHYYVLDSKGVQGHTILNVIVG